MTAPVPRERVTTVRSKSGRIVMQIIRRNGHSATSEFDTHASAFAKIDWLRSHLDNPGPDQRGPAADPQEHAQ